MTVPGTSVQSAKCHITEPEIPTWQSIWQRNDGEGEGASVLLSPKVSAGLWHPVYWWQQTRSRKDQNESILIMFCFLCFAVILDSNAPAASEDDFDTNLDYCGKGKVRKEAACFLLLYFLFFLLSAVSQTEYIFQKSIWYIKKQDQTVTNDGSLWVVMAPFLICKRKTYVSFLVLTLFPLQSFSYWLQLVTNF